LIVLALVAVACATKIAPPHHVQTSADVEAALDPVVKSVGDGKHKLVYKAADGAEKCLVCDPLSHGGCGCGDIVAIRCELKRLKQKLLRLKSIANPHHAHPQEEPVKAAVLPTPAIAPVQVKPAVAPVQVKPAVAPVLVKPAVAPVQVKPAVAPVEVKPAVVPEVKPVEVKPVAVKVAAPLVFDAPVLVKPAVVKAV